MSLQPSPMRLPEGATVAVSLQWDPEVALRVGRLGMRGRQLLFEFDREFLATGLEISPLQLARRPGVIETRDPVFEFLPGVFADSLPDGWGRLLLDRAARRQGMRPELLTPLDRLAHVGRDGIGALIYVPELGKFPAVSQLDLDELADASRALLASDSDALLERLRHVGGSPQGARPKALVQIHQGTGRFSDGQGDLGAGWQHWLVKFAALADVKDIGALEFAYAHMASAAGVEMPPVRLLPARHGPGYFAAQRFDRQGGQRTHVATAAGLLHADFRLPSLDYLDLARLTMRLTRDQREAERLVRLATFNVLAHNRDDHAKQFTFQMDRRGIWQLAPAYDLTFSTGPGGEHSTSVAGEGKEPGPEHLHRLAAVAGLEPAVASQILEQTAEAVARWPEFASLAGVSRATSSMVAAGLRRSGRVAAM